MQTRKIYRIELRDNQSWLGKEIAVIAAYSNGGDYISLEAIEAMARYKIPEMPSTNKDVSINLISPSMLTIDKGTENILTITEVEIMELDKPEMTAQEARDILSGIPTIDRYDKNRVN